MGQVLGGRGMEGWAEGGGAWQRQLTGLPAAALIPPLALVCSCAPDTMAQRELCSRPLHTVTLHSQPQGLTDREQSPAYANHPSWAEPQSVTPVPPQRDRLRCAKVQILPAPPHNRISLLVVAPRKPHLSKLLGLVPHP